MEDQAIIELSGLFPVIILRAVMGIPWSSLYSRKHTLSEPSDREGAFAENVMLFPEYRGKHPPHGCRRLNAKIRFDTGITMSDPYARKCCRAAGIKNRTKRYSCKKQGNRYGHYPDLPPA